MVDIFSIFLFKLKTFCQDRFQKVSLPTNWIYFWNNLPNQIKNSYSVGICKIELDDFRKKN